MKKHKFKLDKAHWNQYHKSIFDIRQIFYIPRCLRCKKELGFNDDHLPETFKIKTVEELIVRG
jgi:hypothetical protein